MKYVLIVSAVIVRVMLTMLVLTIFTHIFDNHERAGQFDIYTNPKVPDSSVHSALYYKRHRLTERLNSYSVDPNNVDRILFSSDDVFHGSEGLCGTFLYDGQSRKLTPLRPWPYGGGLWSPDSRFILLNRATVRELLTGEEVDLMDSISREDGSRVELSILQWSPVRTFLFSGRGQIELNARRRISASLAIRHVRSTTAYQTVADLGLDCETTV